MVESVSSHINPSVIAPSCQPVRMEHEKDIAQEDETRTHAADAAAGHIEGESNV